MQNGSQQSSFHALPQKALLLYLYLQYHLNFTCTKFITYIIARVSFNPNSPTISHDLPKTGQSTWKN